MGMTVSQDRLRSLLDYDPESGQFTWKVSRGRRAKPGTVAGATDTHGHCQIRVDGRSYAAHRLAFLYMTGGWPHSQIDHKNRNRSDNRWANLRDATPSQNCANRLPARNIVGGGYRGVLKVGNRYQAHISFRDEAGKKKRLHLGMFASADDAHQAHLAAAIERHGDFVPK
jgi:hypothetical protein